MLRGENKMPINSISKPLIFAGFLLLGLVGFMIWDQIYWWSNRDDYSFGFLVPLFVLYVLYERKDLIFSFLRGDSHSLSENGAVSSAKTLVKLLNVLFVGVFFFGVILFFIGALIRTATTPQNPASLAIALGFAMILLSSVYIFSEETIDKKRPAIRERLKFVLLFCFQL